CRFLRRPGEHGLEGPASPERASARTAGRAATTTSGGQGLRVARKARNATRHAGEGFPRDAGEARGGFVAGAFVVAAPAAPPAECDCVVADACAGKISDVDHGEVHADGADDGSAPAADEDVALVRSGAAQAVGIAERDGGDA